MTDSVDLPPDYALRSESGVAYRNLQPLGQGGNAATYLMVAVTHAHQGIPFAVKIFRRLSKPEWKDAFFREAEFLKDCDHPAVMRYVDRGVVFDHNPFFVAEYLPDTLESVIRSGRTSMATKLSIATQLLSGLAYLANRSPAVVHRDIKPENIFVKGRSAVLGDFGLIKFRPDVADVEMITASPGPGMPRSYRTPIWFPI